MFEVAPAIGAHEVVELQRLQTYVYDVGEPSQVPTFAKSVCPTWPMPEIDGRTVFVGTVPSITSVFAETAVAVPTLFVAVIWTRSALPTSAFVTLYADEIAPPTFEQLSPSQRCHW